MKSKHTLTILFEDPFWIGLFEKTEDNQMQVCKVTFGAEPTDREVMEFVDRPRILVLAPNRSKR